MQWHIHRRNAQLTKSPSTFADAAEQLSRRSNSRISNNNRQTAPPKIHQAETPETAETKTATTEVATAEIATAETAMTKIAKTEIVAVEMPQAAIAITVTSIHAREKLMKSARTKTTPHIHSH
jgi:hypothetical protein